MDSRELREATRAEHEATEALMPLTAPGLTREIYVRVLQTLFPLLRGWEVWVEGVAEGDLRGMLEKRRRSHLLMADMRLFGAEPAGNQVTVVKWDAIVAGQAGQGASVSSAPGFEARLLGAVYVMEGSTLGGRFLARHVEGALGLAPGVGDSYFQGHGEATGGMWREVLEKISAIPEAHAHHAIASAKRTFEAFGAALRAGESAQQTVLS